MIGKITGMEDILDAMEKKADFYKVLGSLAFGKGYEEVTNEERAEIKSRFWGIFYKRGFIDLEEVKKGG